MTERLSKYSNMSKPLLRPTSSLDSAPTHYSTNRPTSCLPTWHSSSHSALGDVAAILNTSTGYLPAPPLSTTLQAGKSSSGSLMDQLSLSPNRGPILDVPGSRETSPYLKTSPGLSYMTLKDQLKHELKAAVGERRSLLDSRDYSRKSENDVRALFDLYSDVPDVLPHGSSLSRRQHRRNASDSALLHFSPTPELLPSDYYTSDDYDASAIFDSDLLSRTVLPESRSALRFGLTDHLAPTLLSGYGGGKLAPSPVPHSILKSMRSLSLSLSLTLQTGD